MAIPKDTFHWHMDPRCRPPPSPDEMGDMMEQVSYRYERMLEKSMRDLNEDHNGSEYMYKMYHTASFHELPPNTITRLVSRLTYKPNSKVWVECGHTLVMVLDVPDRDHPERTVPVVSRQDVPPSMVDGGDSEEAMMDWVRNCLGQLEDHEKDEWLKLDGKRWRDPHAGEIRVDWKKGREIARDLLR